MRQPPRRRIAARLAAAVLLWLGLGGAAIAQEEAAPEPEAGLADPAAAAEIEALIRTLENDADRARLIARLRTLLDTQQALQADKVDLLESLRDQTQGFLSEQTDALLAASSGSA